MTDMAPPPPIFIGCATDRKFVMPTCAMLSSLEENGDLPGATILVADFGLNEGDRVLLRDSAGRLGEAMRFVAIDRASAKIVALPTFDFPLPLLGRLILPREIDVPGARLLLLDSDIVVNRSLRPLVEMDMLGRPLAAAWDALMEIEYHHHRKSGPRYFNAGLMLLDVDRFNARSIGEESMRRLAGYREKPIYLDQCAMNETVGDDWLEIDRRWNFFQTGYDRHFERADYEDAAIIHYAGWKPWDVDWHPAGPIWNHHATQAQLKATAWRRRVNAYRVDRHFVARQYEMLLGRSLESETVAAGRASLSATEATAAILRSPEFENEVLGPIMSGTRFQPGRFATAPSIADRYWAADSLPVLPRTAAALPALSDPRAVITALVADDRLMGVAERNAVVPGASADARAA